MPRYHGFGSAAEFRQWIDERWDSSWSRNMMEIEEETKRDQAALLASRAGVSQCVPEHVGYTQMVCFDDVDMVFVVAIDTFEFEDFLVLDVCYEPAVTGDMFAWFMKSADGLADVTLCDSESANTSVEETAARV